jgi:hypothetical protein
MRTSITTSLLLTIALSAMTSALPASTSNILARAGAPAIDTIPSTCTITYPLPSAPPTTYQPGPAAHADLLYNQYYSLPGEDNSKLAQRCLEQCYGYGTHVECKSAFWANNIVIPANYYGSAGGGLSTGCLMFKRALTSEDFVVAPAGQATDAFAGNIAC